MCCVVLIVLVMALEPDMLTAMPVEDGLHLSGYARPFHRQILPPLLPGSSLGLFPPRLCAHATSSCCISLTPLAVHFAELALSAAQPAGLHRR